MRKRIFEIIEVAQDKDKPSAAYDLVMICAIVISIIPLAFKEAPTFFDYTDIITVILFIVDYLLRLFTADYKIGRKGLSFFIYPFTPWAIIDLIYQIL